MTSPSSEMRMIVQVFKSGAWQTVQVDGYRSYNANLMRILMAQKQVSYPSIQGSRGFPADLSVTYDTQGYTTFDGAGTQSYSTFIRPSYIDGFYIGNHSFTWLILKEMNDYPWLTATVLSPDIILQTRIYNIPVAAVACEDFYQNELPKLNQLAADNGVTSDNLRVILGLLN